MKKDIEKAIRKFYTKPEYVNLRDAGLDLEGTRWGQKIQKHIVDRLKKQVDAQLLYATDEDYDFSELIKFFDGRIYLRISFLGPFAYLSLKGLKGEEREKYRKMVLKIKRVLREFNLKLLSAEEVQESVPWLLPEDSLVGDRVKVWNCLFCEY